LTKDELVEIVIPLRQVYLPKLERFFGYEAEDIFANAVASTLARASIFQSSPHVQIFFAKNISGRIKSEFRRNTRKGKLTDALSSDALSSERLLVTDISGRYDLRQALNLALDALTPPMKMAVWRVHALGETQRIVAKSLKLTRDKLRVRLKVALLTLREHPALSPWKRR